MSDKRVKPGIETYRFPAEFEPHEAIWLGWPVYENKKGLSTVPVMLKIIKELAPYVKVKIAAQDDEEKNKIIALLKEKQIPFRHVYFYTIPHADIWFRDMGPIFLKSDNGNLKIVKFNFNMWGYNDVSAEECAVDREVPQWAANWLKLDVVETEMVSEGGDREFNGKGTMIAVKAVEMQRNMGMTCEEIEAEFKRVFHLKKIIWLEQGIYEDDHTFMGQLPGPDGIKNICTPLCTGGHIDEFCRFVSPDTLLLAEATEEEASRDLIAFENRKRLETNFAILKKEKDQDGNPFKIIRMPMPESLFFTMEPGDGIYDAIAKNYKYGAVFPIEKELKFIVAASYLNFLVTNKVVLAQHYWKPGLPKRIKDKDEQALKILSAVFPGRKIIPIDAIPVNLGGGGIHCITQQEPAAPPYLGGLPRPSRR